MSAHPSARNNKTMTRRAAVLAATAAAAVTWLTGLAGAVPSASAATNSASGSGAPGWIWAVLTGLAAGLVIIILAGWLVTSSRRPKGVLAVWLGTGWRCLDPIEAYEPLELDDIFPAAGCPDGWALCWHRRAPVIAGPRGPALQLAAGQTSAMDTQPPVTFTWLPGGFDTSLSVEPPGRPIRAVTDPMPIIDRTNNHAD